MIRTKPTYRNNPQRNIFKNLEIDKPRLYRKDNYTLWIVLLTIAMGLIVLANEAGIIHVVSSNDVTLKEVNK
jgi:hypothetical protein